MNAIKNTGRILFATLLGTASLLAEETVRTEVTTKTDAAKEQGISAATGAEVGIAASDGITLSGTQALVTRNGVSEKLIKPIELDNGTKITPDGMMLLKSGEKVALRAGQLLNFDGKLMNLHAEGGEPGKATRPNALTTDATVATPRSTTTTTTTVTENGTKAVSKDAAAKAEKEIERRENEVK